MNAPCALFVALTIGLSAAAAAQEPAADAAAASDADAARVDPPLFTDTTTLQIVIEGPLHTLVRNAADSTDAYRATLTLVGEGAGAAQSFPIDLSARGLTRRKGDVCRFPPLRVNFDRSEQPLDDTVFERQNKLKLVTHCQSSGSYAQYYAREYVAYRLYNEITPVSFRVRPLEVTYRDTEGRRREETRFGFFIEDVGDAAKRNGFKKFDDVNEIAYAQLHPEHATLGALYQFMIGNLDWDFSAGPYGDDCCHNARLVGDKAATDDLRPMPYDFDYSGIVDASYAVPPPSINVRDVTVRRYRGLCRHNAELPAARARYQAARAAVFAVIDGDPVLDNRSRGKVRRYVEGFYKVLDDDRRFERDIVGACR